MSPRPKPPPKRRWWPEDDADGKKQTQGSPKASSRFQVLGVTENASTTALDHEDVFRLVPNPLFEATRGQVEEEKRACSPEKARLVHRRVMLVGLPPEDCRFNFLVGTVLKSFGDIFQVQLKDTGECGVFAAQHIVPYVENTERARSQPPSA